MTDIVARLRGTTLYQGYGEESDLPEQAADEIERLRGTLSYLKRQAELGHLAPQVVIQNVDFCLSGQRRLRITGEQT